MPRMPFATKKIDIDHDKLDAPTRRAFNRLSLRVEGYSEDRGCGYIEIVRVSSPRVPDTGTEFRLYHYEPHVERRVCLATRHYRRMLIDRRRRLRRD